MVKTAKGLSGNDLCALCFLFVHSLVFIPQGFREKKILIPQKEKRTINQETREDAERLKFAYNCFSL